MSKSSEIRRASSFLGPSGSMAEVTWDAGRSPRLQFLLQMGKNGSSVQKVLPALNLADGSSLAPPADPHDLVRKDIILLPSRLPERPETREALVDAMSEWILKWCDFPAFWARLISHYALMTWVYDRFTAVPYLRFLGEPASGKTRALMVAANLCYKAILCGGATSSSPVFRLLDVWRGTFVIDEADYGKSDLYSDIIKILNGGYASRLAVLRSEKSGTSYDPCGFEVFGPKILSTRKEFEDQALETRCLTLRTSDREVRADIPRQLPEEFFSEALEFRNRCLAFRLSSYHEILGDQRALGDLPPRLAQIAIPIWAISPSPKFRLELLEFLSSSSREQKATTPLSLVAEALRRLTVNEQIWPTTRSVKEVLESAAEVSSDFGADHKFSAREVGSLLRALGLTTFRGAHGVYEFSISKQARDEIEKRYKAS